jgi:hypothetical protein
VQRNWRRLHGSDIIAQVQGIPGFGTWEVAVWRTSSPQDITRLDRRFSLLTEAQRAADALSASVFGHLCQTGQCGHWLGWLA